MQPQLEEIGSERRRAAVEVVEALGQPRAPLAKRRRAVDDGVRAGHRLGDVQRGRAGGCRRASAVQEVLVYYVLGLLPQVHSSTLQGGAAETQAAAWR